MLVEFLQRAFDPATGGYLGRISHRFLHATIRTWAFWKPTVRRWNGSVLNLHVDSSEIFTPFDSCFLLIRAGAPLTEYIDAIHVSGFRLHRVYAARSTEGDLDFLPRLKPWDSSAWVIQAVLEPTPEARFPPLRVVLRAAGSSLVE